MVRIIGNSIERVPIPDLGDVVYYRQTKDYTDQEYANSKDLQREIVKGRLTKLEVHASAKGSSEITGTQPVNGSSVSLSDLKQALKEHVPQVDIKGALQDLAPMIAGIVRQEVSKISITGVATAPVIKSTFEETGYVPTVSTEGMVSNVTAKETAVDGGDTDDTLKLLRQMQKGSQ